MAVEMDGTVAGLAVMLDSALAADTLPHVWGPGVSGRQRG